LKKTILIVDDAASMRGLVAMTIRNNGYDVIEACDGKDALSKIQGKKLNLIVTDLNMPNMNGIELVLAVKKLPAFKFTPVVMLTTESDESKKMQGKAAGVKAWVVKPFKPDVLLKVIQKIIG